MRTRKVLAVLLAVLVFMSSFACVESLAADAVKSSIGATSALDFSGFNTALQTGVKKVGTGLNSLLSATFNGVRFMANALTDRITLTQPSPSQTNSTVYFEVGNTYTVRLPMRIRATKPTEEKFKYDIVAEDVMLPVKTELGIYLLDTGTMVNARDESVELKYTVYKDVDGKTDVAMKTPRDRVLKVPAGFPEGKSGDIYATLNEHALYAGLYLEDTATFEIRVTDKTYTDEDIAEIENNYPDPDEPLHVYKIGKTVPEYVIAEFNEDFTGVTVFANGGTTDGLMMDWTSGDENNPFYMHRSTLQTITFTGEYTPLKSIGNYAFKDCTALTGTVTIPNSVETIGTHAFENCTGITHLIIAGLDTGIDSGAAGGSGGGSGGLHVSLNNTLAGKLTNALRGGSSDGYPEKKPVLATASEVVGAYAFAGCTGITELEIGNTVKTLSDNAFRGCTGLTEVNTGASCDTVGSAFSGCTNLEKVVIQNAPTASFDFGVANDTLDNWAQSDCKFYLLNEEITRCPSTAEGIEIYFGKTVETIGTGAFAFNPNPNGAYKDTNPWTRAEIITRATAYHFQSGSALKTIGNYAFAFGYYNSQYHVDINPVTGYTYWRSDYPSRYYQQTTDTDTGAHNNTATFDGLDLTNVETIGSHAFYSCENLSNTATTDWRSETLKNLGSYAFAGTNLTFNTVVFPETLETLGAGVFMDLSHNGFAESVYTDYNDCYGFSKPAQAKNSPQIKHIVFDDCAIAVPNDFYSSKVPVDGNDHSSGGNKYEDSWARYLPILSEHGYAENSVEAKLGLWDLVGYKKVENYDRFVKNYWTEVYDNPNPKYSEYAPLPEAEFTKYEEFYTAPGVLESVDFGSKITSIGDSAFAGQKNLETVTFPSTCTAIGDKAFLCAHGLESIDLGANIQSVGKFAFALNRNLSSVTFHGSLENIEEGTFRWCYELDDFTWPTGVKTIGNAAFESTGVNATGYPATVETIGDCAFVGCPTVNHEFVGTSVLESVGERAFDDTGITSVDLGPNAVTVKQGAFLENPCTTVIISNEDSVMDATGAAFGPSVTNVTVGIKVLNDAFFKGIGCKDYTNPWTLTVLNTVEEIHDLGNSNYGIKLDAITTSGISAVSGTVVLPNSVTVIGNKGLGGSPRLHTVTLPNALATIGDSAFVGTPITGTLTIPNTVTTIGNAAFSGRTGLTGAMVIPNSVTSIGANAFMNCSGLTSVTLPETIDTIANSTFYGCSGLTSLDIPSTVTSIGSQAFYRCTGLDGTLVIPEGVESIGSLAFSGCTSLDAIAPFPSTLTTLESRAFADDTSLNMASLTIPATITTIGEGAFSGCGRLGNVTIANDAVVREEFKDATLSGVTFTGNITSIAQSAFANAGLEGATVTLPANCETVAANAFADSKLSALVCDSALKTIGQSAFAGCTQMTSVTLNEGLETIQSKAFYCALKNSRYNENSALVIPNTVTTIGDHAFAGGYERYYDSTAEKYKWRNSNPSYTSLVLGTSLETIGAYAFANNVNLSGVIAIPDSVVSIGNYAFALFAPDVFYEGSALINSEDKTTGVTFGSGLETIGTGAFLNRMKNTTSLSFGPNLDTIGDRAFYNCDALDGTLTFPDSVTEIGAESFYHCSSLDKIITGSGLERVGDRAFYEFTGIVEMTEVIENIGEDAFGTPHADDDGAVYLGGYLISFTNIRNLEEYTVRPGTVSVNENAFEGVTGLKTVNLPTTVISIGDNAFKDCEDLETVTGTKNIRSIGNNAFEGCEELESLGDAEDGGFYITSEGVANFPSYLTSTGTDIFLDAGIPRLTDVTFGQTDVNKDATNILFYYSNSYRTIVDDNATVHFTDGVERIEGSDDENGTINGQTRAFGRIKSGSNYSSVAIVFSGDVTFPDSLKFVGYEAFTGHRFTSVAFGEGVEKISGRAFSGNNTVTSGDIYLPVCETVGSEAFRNFGTVDSVTLGNKDVTVSTSAFSGVTTSALSINAEEVTGTNLGAGVGDLKGPYTVTLGPDVEIIDNVNLKVMGALVIPANVVRIGGTGTAFYGYDGYYGSAPAISSLTFESTSTDIVIQKKAFYCCRFGDVHMSGRPITMDWGDFPSTSYVDCYAFHTCTADLLDVSDSVEFTERTYRSNTRVLCDFDGLSPRVLKASFDDRLKVYGTRNVSGSVIDVYWYDCNICTGTNLETVEVTGESPSYVVYRVDTNKPLVTPPVNYSQYEEYSTWDYDPVLSRAQTVIIDEGVTELKCCAFYGGNDSRVATVTLPSTLTTIGELAFANQTHLTDIAIPAGCTVKTRAFQNAVVSGTVTVPGSAHLNPAAFTVTSGGCTCSIAALVFGSGYDYTADFRAAEAPVGEDKYENYLGDCAPVQATVGELTINGNVPLYYATYSKDYVVVAKGTEGAEERLDNVIFGYSSYMEGISRIHLGATAHITRTQYGDELRPEQNYITDTYYYQYGSRDFNTLGVTSLIGVDCDSNNPYHAASGGVLYSKPGYELQIVPYNLTGDLVVPEGVRSLPISAFAYRSGITGITLPSTLQAINPFAFEACTGVTGTVNIPNNVRLIGNESFRDCSSIERISLPTNCETIGASAFENCSSAEMEIRFGPTFSSLGTNAFRNCGNIAVIEINEPNLTSIGGFAGCSSATGFVKLGPATRTVSENAFDGCAGMTSIDLTNATNLTTIGNNAFRGWSSLTGSLVIPNSVTSIGTEAFFDGTLENTVTSMTLGTGLASLGDRALAGHPNLATITGNSRFPVENNVLTDGNGTILVGTTAVPANYTVPAGIKKVGDYAFAHNPTITSITVPSYVKSVGKAAFMGVPNLTSLTFAEGITSVGDYSFAYNTSLVGDIQLPDSLLVIGAHAFDGCTAIHWIGIGPNTGSVGEDAFKDVTGVTLDPDNPYIQIVDEEFVEVPGSTFSQHFIGPASDPTAVMWTLSSDGTTITISGDGPTKDYNYASQGPLYSLVTGSESTVTGIVVEDGVTRLGRNILGYPYNPLRLTAGKDLAGIDQTIISYFDVANTTIDSNNRYMKREGDFLLSYDGTRLMLVNRAATSVTVPNTVTQINQNAFVNCNAQSVTLPESVQYVGTQTFQNCYSLNTLRMPGVRTTGENIAVRCPNLKDLYVPVNMSLVSMDYKPFKDTYNYIPYGDVTIHLIGSGAAVPYNLTFAGVMNGTVNTVPWFAAALANMPATRVEIGDGITALSDFMFCGLFGGDTNTIRTVVLGRNLETIPMTAFIGQQILTVTMNGNTNFALSDGVLTTADGEHLAIITSAATSLELPYGDTFVPLYFGVHTNLTNLVLGNQVTEIESYGLAMMPNLTSVSVVNENTVFGEYILVECGNGNTITVNGVADSTAAAYVASAADIGITNLVFNPVTFGPTVNYDENTKTLTLTNGDIGNFSFNGTTSTSPYAAYLETAEHIVIGEGVTRIGNYAFAYGGNACTVQDITIGADVAEIGTGAFQGLDTDILDFTNNPNYSMSNGMLLSGDGATLYVAATDANGVVAVPNGVTALASGCFDGLTVTEVDLPTSVTYVPADTFSGMTSLEVLKMPGIRSAGYGIARGCENLTDIYLPIDAPAFNMEDGDDTTGIFYDTYENSVPEGDITIHITGVGGAPNDIGFDLANEVINLSLITYALAYIPATKVVVENGVTSLPTFLFSAMLQEDGPTIQTFVLGTGLTYIDPTAFVAQPLTTVDLNGNTNFALDNGSLVSADGTQFAAFTTAATSFVAPSGMTEIPIYFGAFSGITSITLGNHVTAVHEYAFAMLPNLQTVTVLNSNLAIGEGAFSECGSDNGVENNVVVARSFAGSTVQQAIAYLDPSDYGTNFVFEELMGPTATYDASTKTLTLSGDTPMADCAIVNGQSTSQYAQYLEQAEHIVIADDVVNIGAYAFAYTGNSSTVQDITVGSGVQTIGTGAFQGLDLSIVDFSRNSNFSQSGGMLLSGDGATLYQASADANGLVSVPEGVTALAADAFTGVAATEIDLPTTVTYVGDGAFANMTSLEVLKMPNVLLIGDDVTTGCTNLTDLYIPANIGGAYDVNAGERNDPFNDTDCDPITLHLTGNGDTVTFDYTIEDMAEEMITAQMNEEEFTAFVIPSLAFYVSGMDIDTVVIEDGVTDLPLGTFLEKEIGTLVLGADVENIAANAFAACTINNIDLGENTNFIMEEGNLLKADRSAYVTTLSSATKVIIPGGMERVPFYAASGLPNATQLVVEEGVKILDAMSLVFDGFTDITIPNDLELYQYFKYSMVEMQAPLSDAGFGAPVTLRIIGTGDAPDCSFDGEALFAQLGEYMESDPLQIEFAIPFTTLLEESNITTVVIDDEVTSIPGYMFCNMFQGGSGSIQTLTLGSGLTDMGDCAFTGQPLTTINLNGNTNFTVEDGILYDSAKTRIYALQSSVTDLTIPDTMTVVPFAFEFGNGYLTSVTIGAGVQKVDVNVLSSCSNLADITVLNPNMQFAMESLLYNCSPTTLHAAAGSTAETYVTDTGDSSLVFAALS